MAYRCSFNPDDEEDTAFAKQINYFSNPDVSVERFFVHRELHVLEYYLFRGGFLLSLPGHVPRRRA